jgi:outer membrane immunogenic protein
MKKFAVLTVSALALVAAATPAAAAAPAGGRIEAVVGWDHVSLDLAQFGGTGDLSESGVVFGLGAGYDFAVSESASVGLDIEGTDATTKFEDPTGKITAGIDLYAGGRITGAVADNVNVYVKAGYTAFRIKATAGGVSDSGTADGLRAGLGLQVAVGGKAYVGAEYRYSNYEAGLTRHQAVATLGTRF